MPSPPRTGSEAIVRPSAMADGKGPPRAIAGRGQTQRRPGEGELVALGRPVVEDRADDAQDVRDPGVQDERLDEVEAFDAAALRAEPARGRDRVGVEGGDRRGDGRPVGGDGYSPELIITCLMNV